MAKPSASAPTIDHLEKRLSILEGYSAIILQVLYVLQLTRKQAAQLIQVSPGTIDRMLSDGRLPKLQADGDPRIPLKAVVDMAIARGTSIEWLQTKIASILNS